MKSAKHQFADSDESSEDCFFNSSHARTSKKAEGNHFKDDHISPTIVSAGNLLANSEIQQKKIHYESYNDETGWDAPKDKKHDRRRKGNFPKFVPHQKKDGELFDEVYQIPEGPKFQEKFQEQSNPISFYGGDGDLSCINSFDQCSFTSEIKNNLLLRKYTRPLPIQSCIIPLIQRKNRSAFNLTFNLHGLMSITFLDDIVAQAQTGSGKTAAIMLPVVNEIQLYKEENNSGKNPGYPFAILIAPTKGLAEQLRDDISSYALGTCVSIFLSFGDMPISDDVRKIKKEGCDIFVGTAGRVRHYVREQIVKLNDLRYFILDEADKLLQDSFFDDIMSIKCNRSINQNHRTLVFSATFEGDIQAKFEQFMRPDYFFVSVGESNRAVDTVEQQIIEVSRYEKYDVLMNLIMKDAKIVEGDECEPWLHYEVEKTIIFAGQKRRTDRIAVALALHGFKVISTNGDRTLQQRMEAKDGFIRGQYDIMVATDVFSRGLNVPYVSHVINFDVPKLEVMSYIHRIGRTGRAGNLGRATTFFDVDEDAQHAGFYVQVLEDANQEVPKFLQEILDSQKLADEEVLQSGVHKDKGSHEAIDIWS